MWITPVQWALTSVPQLCRKGLNSGLGSTQCIFSPFLTQDDAGMEMLAAIGTVLLDISTFWRNSLFFLQEKGTWLWWKERFKLYEQYTIAGFCWKIQMVDWYFSRLSHIFTFYPHLNIFILYMMQRDENAMVFSKGAKYYSYLGWEQLED